MIIKCVHFLWTTLYLSMVIWANSRRRLPSFYFISAIQTSMWSVLRVCGYECEGLQSRIPIKLQAFPMSHEWTKTPNFSSTGRSSCTVFWGTCNYLSTLRAAHVNANRIHWGCCKKENPKNKPYIEPRFTFEGRPTGRRFLAKTANFSMTFDGSLMADFWFINRRERVAGGDRVWTNNVAKMMEKS